MFKYRTSSNIYADLSLSVIKKVIGEYMPETFTTLLLKNKLRELGYFATQDSVSAYCLELVDSGELTFEVEPNWQRYSTTQFNLYTKVQEEEVELEDFLSPESIARLLAHGIDLQGVTVTKKNF